MKKTYGLKNLFTTTLLVSSLSFSSVVFAQFDKYQSSTTFTDVEGSEAVSAEDVQIPDTSKSASTLLDESEFSDDSEGEYMEDYDSGAGGGGGGGGSPRVTTGRSQNDAFGRQQQGMKKPNGKRFVNLNPETAFGPEVVESFDFPDVSIVDLTKKMQEMTGINLIVDKDIKGKISISTQTPITIGDAWKAYLQALSINGYSLVKSGAFYTIVNNRDIRYSPTKMYTGNYTPDTESYVMQIIPLKYVSSREITNSFRPFMSRYGRILEIRQTNTIIIQETGTHINRLMKLIKSIDIPGHEDSLQIIQVKNTSAQEIANLLDKILKNNSTSRTGVRATTASAVGGASESASNISRIIAEPRTNSIIAMANSEGAKELKNLISKLDVKIVAAGTGQIHVYYLNYGDAETLSKTLSSLVGNAPRNGAATGLARFTSNAGAATTPTLFNSEVKVTSDKDNNALVVTASPTDYETVKAVISKLDIPRDQVYVEGLMMETQINKGQGFGISLVGVHGAGAASKVGYGKTTDLMNLIGNNITNLSGLFLGGGIGRKVDMTTPSGTKIQVNSINGLISAIATHNTTNVLATPQILTMDNTEGTFENGEQVPITETTNAANGSSQTSVKQQKVALTLKITPQINKATRMIKLKIDQKIEDFSSRELPAGVANNGVGTVLRNINTTVVVRDKDTIAMGGLMRDKETNNTSKVPLLGDIPVLGWLFKNTTKSVEKVNLLFFMTPKILASYEKENSANVKDLLNRRQSHLKNITDDKDAFHTTVKGLYDKASKQAEGPLYDKTELDKFNNGKKINEDEEVNVEAQLNDKADFAPNVDAPDYQEILKKAETNKTENTDYPASVE